MKKVLISVLVCLSVQYASGQNIPKFTSRISATPVTTPAVYSNTLTNFIRTWEPNMPTTDTAVVKSPSRTPQEVYQKTDYYDGLGRPIQSVTKAVSPSGKDFVSSNFYDAYGRETIQYLPYTPKTGNINDGKFKTDPFNAQRVFYQDTILNPSAAGESIYYGRTDFEASPLNRALKVYAAGNAMAKEGGNRPIESQYLVNTVGDSVRLFTLADNAILPSSSSFYGAGTLFKTVTIDENGTRSIEFKNKEGRVILKRSQVSNAPSTAHIGWLSTYYIYNSRGLLAFVIAPKAVDIIKGSWSVSSAIAGELCYIYRYDKRNRRIVSKFPSADSLEMVYDKRDRLVVRRNGILKQRGMCIVNAYDSINRPYMQALFYTAASREQIQTAIDNLVNPDPKIPLPFIPDSNLIYRDYIYYDNYNFPGKANYSTTDLSNLRSGSNPYSENSPASASLMTKGLVTGRKTFVISTLEDLPTTIYYNNKGRVIQTISENYAGGTDIINTKYDFSGKILSTYQRHTNPRSTLTPSATLQTMFHYDAGGRLDSIKKILNDNILLTNTIALHSYTETGQKLATRLNANGGNQIEVLNYSYNIRKLMTGINKNYVNTLNSTSNWFGQEISYESGFDSSYRNGNISGLKWKTRSDGLAKAFGYNYDRANRLISAYFTQQNQGSTSWLQNLMNFSVSNISYDANGNIGSMKHLGMNGPLSSTIDSLKYGYFTNSNRLSFVTDKVNNPSTTLGDFHETVNNETQDYYYDPNGNVCKDSNRNIDTIMYDHNNLPGYIQYKDKGSIWFIYDGQGNKVSKVSIETNPSSKVTVTHYCGDFIYVQDSLQYISHEMERIRPIYKSGQPVQYTFDYFIKDHLGNVRVVLGTKTDTAIYAATMETSASAVENALFSNIDNTRSVKPTGYPADNTTNPNTYVAKLNGSGQRIGPSLVLRVMAGDTIQIVSKSYYQSSSANTSANTTEAMVNAILQAFTGSTVADGPHNGTGPGSPLNTSFNSSIFNSLKDIDPSQDQSSQPKAYLNFVLFDDQFNIVNENSGVKQVQGSTGELINLIVNKQAIKKTGFFYIYLSNESSVDVFFDNLIITHLSGPLLEESHYYPFGLTMAGISSNAIKGNSYPENKLRFNGKEFQTQEFSDGEGLNWYDYKRRMYDQQIGRFVQVDSLADKFPYLTPFQYASNDPVKNIDLDGLEGLVSPLVFGTEPPIVRGPIIEGMLETGAKVSEVSAKVSETSVKTPKFTSEQLANFSRGAAAEAQQLAEAGLEKNFKPIEYLDPKTGELGRTVPDALRNGGKATTEVKNVKSQGLTKQLRIQEKYSNDNGFNPELIINEGAKISKPLKNSSFDIKTYGVAPPAMDNTIIRSEIFIKKIP